MRDPELTTRNRVTGLQLPIQQNTSSKRELGASLEGGGGTESLWFGIKRIYLLRCKHLLAARDKTLYLHEKYKAYRLFWWHHYPSWPTKPPRVSRRAVAFLQLWRTNHTAVTLTRNYYMQWLLFATDWLLSLINHTMLSFDWRFSLFFQSAPFFSCLTGFTLAYTNIALSKIRKQHIKMRSCRLQKEMSDALLHIFSDYKSCNVNKKVWLE